MDIPIAWIIYGELMIGIVIRFINFRGLFLFSLCGQKYYCVYHPQSMVGIINLINNINSSDISGSMSNTSSSDDQNTFVDGRSGEDRDDDDDDGDRRGTGRGGSEDNVNNRGPGSD